MARLILTICFLSLTACRSTELLHINLDEITSDAVFFVDLDPKTKNLRIINELGRAPAENNSSPLVQFSISKADTAIHMIGVQSTVLRTFVSTYDSSRLNELQLRLKTPDSPATSDLQSINLPSDFEYSTLDLSTGEFSPASKGAIEYLQQTVELLVPLDFDACRNPDRELLSILYEPAENCSKPFTGLHDVDDDRFVGVTDNGAQIFSRSKPNDCGTVISSTAASARGTRLRLPELEDNFAIGTTPLEDGSYLVLTAFNERVDKTPIAYHITERRLFENGFGPVRFTKTLVPEDFPNLTSARKIYITDVKIDTNNTAYVVFSKGTILLHPLNNDDYEIKIISEFTNNPRDKEIRHLATRSDSDSPHLLSTEGNMYLGNIYEDKWDKISLAPLEQVLTPWESIFSHRPNLSEFYFAGNDGAQGWLVKGNSNALEEIPILYPERLSACFTKGRPDKLRRLLLDDDALYALPNCNTVIRIRHEDQCASFMNFEVNPQYMIQEGTLRAMILRNKQLILAGRDDKIYSFDLSNID